MKAERCVLTVQGLQGTHRLLSRSLFPRGSEYPNSKALGPQNPYSEGFLDLETLLFGHLEP